MHAKSGIRTHEAYAADLKSAPFNHSGILASYNYSHIPHIYMKRHIHILI